MNAEPTPDEIERQVAEFTAELESAINVNLDGFRDDVVRLGGLLLAAQERREVTMAVLELSASAGKVYTSLVLEEVLTTWVRWVLYEGNAGLLPQYTRHLQVFILAARAVGITSQSADSDGTSPGVIAGKE